MTEERSKQVIVVRSDLKMSKGKIASQVAHASLANILSLMTTSTTEDETTTKTLVHGPLYNGGLHQWLEGSFFKIVLKVDSESGLLDVYNESKRLSLNSTIITDQGHTCFNGVPTNTVVAIGPHFEADFLGITDHLKLL